MRCRIIGIFQKTSFFGNKTNFVFFFRAYYENNLRICLHKNNSKQSYVWIDSIFEAQNICFGSEIAEPLDHS